jgi:hypothetical protein
MIFISQTSFESRDLVFKYTQSFTRNLRPSIEQLLKNRRPFSMDVHDPCQPVTPLLVAPSGFGSVLLIEVGELDVFGESWIVWPHGLTFVG